MSYNWCDNIHTTAFTPRDYQVELLALAFEDNTIVCLGHKSSKQFIALKLLQELAKEARSAKKVFIYLTCNGGESMDIMIGNLTDLKTIKQQINENNISELPSDCEVIIVDPQKFHAMLENKVIEMKQVLLIILDDCHEVDMLQNVLPIFRKYYCKSYTNELPKVLALAGPLHNAGCKLQELNFMVHNLEKEVHCRVETASDIVTVLRDRSGIM